MKCYNMISEIILTLEENACLRSIKNTSTNYSEMPVLVIRV